MRAVGDRQSGIIRPDFDRSISIDFQGAKITSDAGFLLMREIDQRFSILSEAASQIDDPRSPRHTDHSLLQLLRQRVYQVAAGYEDRNDADDLRADHLLHPSSQQQQLEEDHPAAPEAPHRSPPNERHTGEGGRVSVSSREIE